MHSNKRQFEKDERLESRSSKKLKKLAPILEEIINSPGLQHIAEEIFLNLDFNGIMTCKLVNDSCKDIVDKRIFWLKKWKMRGLSNENYKDWVNAIQMTKNITLEKNIHAYIKMVIEIGHFVDVPCYIDSKIILEFSNESSFWKAFIENNAGILQLLAVEYIKDINEERFLKAVDKNKLDVIKVLAPLLQYPNPSVKKFGGITPISVAASRGHLNLIKFLVPLTQNPNLLIGIPIHAAAMNGHADVIKYLAPLTKNPNAQDSMGRTPIYLAAQNGHLECIKVLAPLCKNPNTPLFVKPDESSAQTPIQAAEMNGHDEIKSFLQSFL